MSALYRLPSYVASLVWTSAESPPAASAQESSTLSSTLSSYFWTTTNSPNEPHIPDTSAALPFFLSSSSSSFADAATTDRPPLPSLKPSTVATCTLWATLLIAVWWTMTVSIRWSTARGVSNVRNVCTVYLLVKALTALPWAYEVSGLGLLMVVEGQLIPRLMEWIKIAQDEAEFDDAMEQEEAEYYPNEPEQEPHHEAIFQDSVTQEEEIEEQIVVDVDQARVAGSYTLESTEEQVVVNNQDPPAVDVVMKEDDVAVEDSLANDPPAEDPPAAFPVETSTETPIVSPVVAPKPADPVVPSLKLNEPRTNDPRCEVSVLNFLDRLSAGVTTPTIDLTVNQPSDGSGNRNKPIELMSDSADDNDEEMPKFWKFSEWKKRKYEEEHGNNDRKKAAKSPRVE